MTEVYSILMNKGGVTKTTTITNLAAAASTQYPDKKILIIDTDPQGNASLSFGIDPSNLEETILDVMTDDLTLDHVKIKIKENLDIVPSNDELNYFELDVIHDKEKYPHASLLLKKAIEENPTKYDLVFIDSPPGLGLTASNILMSVTKIIIPFEPELYAVQGLGRVVRAFNDFKINHNPYVELAGVVGVKVKKNTNLHTQMIEQARDYCNQQGITMFNTLITNSIKFANATAFENAPAVWSSEKKSAVVQAYFHLLEEVLVHGKTKAAVK